LTDINTVCEFMRELDALKLVNRRSYVGGGVRLENSAEHSWHLAMACWSIARQFNLAVDEGELLKLALVHDLGEIDAGDTFLYAVERAQADKAERACVARMQQHPGNGIQDLLDYWEEQETGSSPETKLIKVVDRLLPFLSRLAGKRCEEIPGAARSRVYRNGISADLPMDSHQSG
jgi:putative hydrolase of HD superfamily